MKKIIIGSREVELKELIDLKGDKDLGKVKDIKDVKERNGEALINLLAKKKKEVEIFVTLKQDIKEESIDDIEDRSVRGFLITSDVEKAKDKVLMVERFSKHQEKDIYCVIVKGVEDAIELQFVEEIFEVEFEDKPFIEKIEEINEVLVKKFDTRKRDIESIKREIERHEEAIREHREYLTEEYKKVKKYSNRLTVLENTNIKDAYQNELRNLAEHPMFENMTIKERGVEFITKYIDIYDPINKGVVYFGNKYRIVLDMNNSRIEIHGLDEERCNRSYWSENDPHPHVSGNSGYACLGSLTDTIAQLCSENELYALFVVIVNFLETFNIDDYAGKHIKNWEVKEGGAHPYAPKQCPICEEEIEEPVICQNCGIEYCEAHEVWNEYREQHECPGCYNEYCEEQEEEGEEEVLICPVCGNGADELHDYINEDGNITRICEECINE